MSFHTLGATNITGLVFRCTHTKCMSIVCACACMCPWESDRIGTKAKVSIVVTGLLSSSVSLKSRSEICKGGEKASQQTQNWGM